MTLRELKDWVNSLPKEYDEHVVVLGKVGTLNNEHMYRVDNPVTTCMVDLETNEIVLMSDDDEIIDININGNNTTEPGA